MTDYISDIVKRRFAQIKDEIKSLEAEESLLTAGCVGKALVTTVCMTDEPLVLFVGDTIQDKYGNERVIKGWNDEFIQFEDGSELQHHRISYVVHSGPLREAYLNLP